MKTAHKIALARMAYHAVHIGRAAFGETDSAIAVRDGVTYDLDIGQGIDFAIYLGNFFERDTRRALSDLTVPGSTVLDIGANIGAHTLHLARCVGPNGRVLAFEPTDYAFRKLSRNLALNPGLTQRVSLYHCFLASHDGDRIPQAIYSSWPLTDRASGVFAGDDVHAEHLGRAMRTDAAKSRSIDSVLAENGNPTVHLVKLDVDGFECEILRGAQEMMSGHKPIFVMELAPYVLDERGASLGELIGLFRPHGYKFYHERTKARLPDGVESYKQLIEVGESINVIARAG
ncbi:MAG: FkbM family methyltransferase [Pseudomonadota bacterium]